MQQNHRTLPRRCLQLPSDHPDRLHPVHPRHVVITDNHVKHRSPFHHLQRRQPIPAALALYPPASQHVLQNQPVVRVGVNDQTPPHTAHPVTLTLLPALHPGPQFKEKSAPLPSHTLHLDPAPHLPRNTIRNQQPEPSPAILPRRRTVRLRKRLEQLLTLLRRDPDPRVPHRYRKPPVPLLLSRILHLQLHFPLLRELHCIAQKIRQHLLQPDRINHRIPRHLPIDIQQNLQPLPPSRKLHYVHAVLQQLHHVRPDHLQLHHPRLDLRQIKNLIDHVQQRVPRHIRVVHILLLHRRQRRVPQQIRKPDHPVQRRPDLMTHVRQKLRLRTARRLRTLLRLLQLPLRLVPLHCVHQHHRKQTQQPLLLLGKTMPRSHRIKPHKPHTRRPIHHRQRQNALNPLRLKNPPDPTLLRQRLHVRNMNRPARKMRLLPIRYHLQRHPLQLLNLRTHPLRTPLMRVVTLPLLMIITEHIRTVRPRKLP